MGVWNPRRWEAPQPRPASLGTQTCTSCLPLCKSLHLKPLLPREWDPPLNIYMLQNLKKWCMFSGSRCSYFAFHFFTSLLSKVLPWQLVKTLVLSCSLTHLAWQTPSSHLSTPWGLDWGTPGSKATMLLHFTVQQNQTWGASAWEMLWNQKSSRLRWQNKLPKTQDGRRTVAPALFLGRSDKLGGGRERQSKHNNQANL